MPRRTPGRSRASSARSSHPRRSRLPTGTSRPRCPMPGLCCRRCGSRSCGATLPPTSGCFASCRGRARSSAGPRSRSVAGRDEPVKKYLGVALGVLTAIGGFVDIGDLVTNAQVGARFGMSLAWATVLGVVGICVFAEMSGRVAAVSRRPTFDLVRERLGPRVGFLNLVASMLITFLTFVAEVGGVALSVQLAVSVHELLIVPWVGVAVWLILWKARFSVMENVLGLLGLGLVVFAVALWRLDPDWGALAHQAVTANKPTDEHW